jgi:hypothetical protein
MGADKPEETNSIAKSFKKANNADEYLKVSGLNYSIVRPGSLTNELPLTIELEGKLNKWGEISRKDSPNLDANIR